MSRKEQITSLRLLLGDCLSKELGLVIMASSYEASHIYERFSDAIDSRIWLIETDDPHSIKIVNSANVDQTLVWVSTCS